MDSIIDYAIHAWVIISFINGIVAFSKLKKLPEETEELISDGSLELENAEISPVAQDDNSVIENSKEAIE